MPYLTETMESVLSQDLQDLEVIAVNDGSTDGSGEELDRFAALDSRVTVHHQPNSGWPGMPATAASTSRAVLLSCSWTQTTRSPAML
ncbi:glycosyltransferase family 2 protein [Leucobacter coleopterorum]|uniref:Glycosyltransferase family 2 protein n=1 Tax=Leucobacter coleopterorum TaxID=2714933 RepID=A0ABX6JZY3_9MICO|nr:glycosyltransferase family A protein [Leucobacter coleopterorum]QIM18335.1 glycosyltransferase family 2 protein [Leucobacter coleopterorum]